MLCLHRKCLALSRKHDIHATRRLRGTPRQRQWRHGLWRGKWCHCTAAIAARAAGRKTKQCTPVHGRSASGCSWRRRDQFLCWYFSPKYALHTHTNTYTQTHKQCKQTSSTIKTQKKASYALARASVGHDASWRQATDRLQSRSVCLHFKAPLTQPRQCGAILRGRKTSTGPPLRAKNELLKTHIDKRAV